MAEVEVEHFLEFVEWPLVQEAIAARTQSHPGSFHARELVPSLELDEVRRRQALTLEARAQLEREGGVPDLAGVADVLGMFQRLERRGRLLDSRDLLALAGTLEAGGAARRAFAGAAALGALVALAPGPEGERPDEVEASDLAWARDVQAKIGDYGLVKSSASDALLALRDELRGARQSLHTELAQLCNDPGLLAALAEYGPVSHDGMPCLRIKAESIRRVEGHIRGQAKDGSHFVEPERVRGHYSRIRRLELDEQAEVSRIVRVLGEYVTPRRAAFERLGGGLVLSDVHLAMARWARDLELTPPALSAELVVELRAARHPLIGLRPGAVCVPIDLSLSLARRLVVISGPNGGGKTAAMKTLGLAAAMAQSGSFIAAAAGGRLPIFTRFVSVADARSSVVAGLSHFQAHARELAGLVLALRPGCLVLLDEIGHGTDPGEAAALAQAVLEHVLARGDLIAMATTHLGPLKAFAGRAAGASNAAVELDAQGRPTFALQLGRAGRSYALEAARAVGLPEALVVRAMALHGGAS